FCERGLPPLAREWCVQSGDAHSRSTRRPRVATRGSTSKRSAVRCRVRGWLASCTASAVAEWLIARSTFRPSAASMPVLAPPPPANRSTMRWLRLGELMGSGGVGGKRHRISAARWPHGIPQRTGRSWSRRAGRSWLLVLSGLGAMRFPLRARLRHERPGLAELCPDPPLDRRNSSTHPAGFELRLDRPLNACARDVELDRGSRVLAQFLFEDFARRFGQDLGPVDLLRPPHDTIAEIDGALVLDVGAQSRPGSLQESLDEHQGRRDPCRL